MMIHKPLDPSIRDDFERVASSPPQLQFELLIEFLLGRDRIRGELARQVMTATNGCLNSGLIREAFAANRPEDHRLRLLDVVERTAVKLRRGEWVELRKGTWSFGGNVANKIERVIAVLGHART